MFRQAPPHPLLPQDIVMKQKVSLDFLIANFLSFATDLNSFIKKSKLFTAYISLLDLKRHFLLWAAKNNSNKYKLKTFLRSYV